MVLMHEGVEIYVYSGNIRVFYLSDGKCDVEVTDGKRIMYVTLDERNRVTLAKCLLNEKLEEKAKEEIEDCEKMYEKKRQELEDVTNMKDSLFYSKEAKIRELKKDMEFYRKRYEYWKRVLDVIKLLREVKE